MFGNLTKEPLREKTHRLNIEVGQINAKLEYLYHILGVEEPKECIDQPCAGENMSNCEDCKYRMKADTSYFPDLGRCHIDFCKKNSGF